MARTAACSRGRGVLAALLAARPARAGPERALQRLPGRRPDRRLHLLARASSRTGSTTSARRRAVRAGLRRPAPLRARRPSAAAAAAPATTTEPRTAPRCRSAAPTEPPTAIEIKHARGPRARRARRCSATCPRPRVLAAPDGQRPARRAAAGRWSSGCCAAACSWSAARAAACRASAAERLTRPAARLVRRGGRAHGRRLRLRARSSSASAANGSPRKLRAQHVVFGAGIRH